MSGSREKILAMLAVLNKRWLSQGWRVMDPKDAEPMALAWIEILDGDRIPHECYQELYRRAIDLRAKRLQNGLKCEDFSADLMLACWPGLATEIKQRRIDEKRYLPDTAASDCEKCFGSGMRDYEGKGYGKCECVVK